MTLLAWRWLLAGALLAGHGASQNCRPPPYNPQAKNLAQGRPAWQSSTFQHDIIGYPDKAVDGDCSGDWNHGSCMHTNADNEPGWYVDLGEEYEVTTVVVKNREDCCSERLKGAEIHVGNSTTNYGKSNPLCGEILNDSPGSITTICCNGKKGRYVSINLPRKEYLTVCEVEVHGRKERR